MDNRLEQILLILAQLYAQPLLQSWDRSGDFSQRLPRLARGLANYGILVIMGDQSYSLRGLGDDIRNQIQEWVNGYGQFYNLLTQALFPSYSQITAHYSDDKWPVVIFMQGSSPAVIQRMAGYVAPFIFNRQMDSMVSEAELIGLMDLILEELEANTLPLESYRKLRADGIVILKNLLSVQIRQLLLTDFDQPLFTDSRRFIPVGKVPPVLPEEDSQITRSEPSYTRPDTTKLNQTASMQTIKPPVPNPPSSQPPAAPTTAPEEKQFGSSIPIFFKGKDDSKKIRRPPIPPLPRDKKS